jgi:hypothetical protein
MNTCKEKSRDVAAGAQEPAQLTALLTSAPFLASSAAVNSFSAKETGHMAPSSRFALSLKLNVAYLVLNFCALWKWQATLPPGAGLDLRDLSFAPDEVGELEGQVVLRMPAFGRAG